MAWNKMEMLNFNATGKTKNKEKPEQSKCLPLRRTCRHTWSSLSPELELARNCAPALNVPSVDLSANTFEPSPFWAARWFVPEMVKNCFYSFLVFEGCFELHLPLAFTIMSWSSKRARCCLNMSWESPASSRICQSSHALPSLKTADLPIKQAQIEPKKTK